MSYKDNAIKRDVNGNPIPQYYDTETKQFEVIQGENGVTEVIIIDNQSASITSQDVVNKLDELIEVVK